MKIFQYDTIDSTNNEAKRLMQSKEKSPHLLSMHASRQQEEADSAGRGKHL
nr:hypothetical protein [Bacillus pumilus]